MLKLINIVVALGFVSMTAVCAANTGSTDPLAVPRMSVAKISSGMDSAIGAVQNSGMVKVALGASPRGRTADTSNAPLSGEADLMDDMRNLDGRAIWAGLALMAVIAMRRIRND